GDYAFYGCSSLNNLVLPNSVKSIGMQAFRNCTALKGLILSNTTASIEKHAFYGCVNATVYVTANSKPDCWSEYWNSSYRPTVWGCELSADNTYLVSFVKNDDSITNKNTSNHLAEPIREGYTFGGWALDPESTVPDYDTENVLNLQEGTKVYAIWLPNA
ncbi:MAG: leucine-rich repeat protein, partial [Clostridia bacterium]|nr:leucine-rich repeat protein [Clostridia bacterium]